MGFENSPRDHETWSTRCHVRIHPDDFTSILHSHTPLVPQKRSMKQRNLDRLRLFHQWECLKCNGHGPSVSCVKWPLVLGIPLHYHPVTGCLLESSRTHTCSVVGEVGLLQTTMVILGHGWHWATCWLTLKILHNWRAFHKLILPYSSFYSCNKPTWHWWLPPLDPSLTSNFSNLLILSKLGTNTLLHS